MSEVDASPMRRRDLLALIGTAAGSAVMVPRDDQPGPGRGIHLCGADPARWRPKGASVLILGAGLAGMAAALELRKAGYRVQVLEYGNRAGGRCWTLRGGDTYTELAARHRTANSIRASISIPARGAFPTITMPCSTIARASRSRSKPFIQVNTNAWLHFQQVLRRRPQRYRHVQADFNGYVSELLAKATSQGKLDETVTPEDQEILLRALRGWGALDATTSTRRTSPPATGVATTRIRAAARRQAGSLGADRARRSAQVRLVGRASFRAPITSSRPRCSSRSAAWT